MQLGSDQWPVVVGQDAQARLVSGDGVCRVAAGLGYPAACELGASTEHRQGVVGGESDQLFCVSGRLPDVASGQFGFDTDRVQSGTTSS